MLVKKGGLTNGWQGWMTVPDQQIFLNFFISPFLRFCIQQCSIHTCKLIKSYGRYNLTIDFKFLCFCSIDFCGSHCPSVLEPEVQHSAVLYIWDQCIGLEITAGQWTLSGQIEFLSSQKKIFYKINYMQKLVIWKTLQFPKLYPEKWI